MSPTYILYPTPYKNDCIQIYMMLRYKIFQRPPMMWHYIETCQEMTPTIPQNRPVYCTFLRDVFHLCKTIVYHPYFICFIWSISVFLSNVIPITYFPSASFIFFSKISNLRLFSIRKSKMFFKCHSVNWAAVLFGTQEYSLITLLSIWWEKEMNPHIVFNCHGNIELY